MSTAVTPIEKKRDIQSLLQSDRVKEQLALALPKHLTPEKMTRVALTAILRTPKLLTCTQESLLESMMILSQVGLPPDGRVAHLIPYGDKCTVILDWKGYVELARRNGVVVTSQLVCKFDVFTVQQDDGTGTSKVQHTIDYTKPRGEIYAVYSRAKLPSGEVDYEIMTKDEVEYVRNTFSRGKDADAWRKSWGEMARKTVIRRHAKRWPLDAEVAQALEVENEDARDVTPVKPLFDPVPSLPQETAEQESSPPGSDASTPPGVPAPASGPAEKPSGSGYNYLKALTGLCKLARITEAEVIAFAVGTGLIEESLISFADCAQVAPEALKLLNDNWSGEKGIAAQIMAARGEQKETLL